MKKGITPIIAVIILLLITVALAGLAWTFLSGYFTGMTAQNLALVDYSCTGTTARVIVRNAGTQSIDFGASCSGAGTAVATCGTVTIVKSGGTGTFLAPATSPTGSIPAGSVTTFSETCGATNICTYRFSSTTGAGGPSPNVATVTCP